MTASVSIHLKCCNVNCVSPIKHAVLSLSESLYRLASKISETVLSKIFYVGYKELPAQLAHARTQDLIDRKGAYRLLCQNDQGKNMDVLYIPSAANRTGNAIVLALNTTYQDHHPRHYEHYLNNGADVLLWNQTACTCKQYEQDLLCVLQTLKNQNSHQKICISAYCASVEPSISAAAQLKDPNISLLLDRGHGNVYTLAASQTIFAKTSFVRKILADKFSCDGMQKLSDIPGRITFIAPPANEDQLMHYGRGKKNLTYDLYNERQRTGRLEDSFIVINGGNHWTNWDASIHNKANDFLSENGIISPLYSPVTEDQFPSPPPASFWKRYVIPVLIKSPFDF